MSPTHTTSQKDQRWFRYDPASGRNQAFYLFICDACRREHNNPSSALPDGWSMRPVPEFGETVLHCPDCLEPVRQQQAEEIATRRRLTEDAMFTAMAAEIVNSAPGPVYAAADWGDLSEDGKVWMTAIVREAHKRGAEAAAKIGIHPPEPRQPAWPGPFALHLQKQEGGHYLIAMTPEKALMRLSPLEFFLSAEGARILAWQLLRHADLVEAPGTLPASVGGQA